MTAAAQLKATSVSVGAPVLRALAHDLRAAPAAVAAHLVVAREMAGGPLDSETLVGVENGVMTMLVLADVVALLTRIGTLEPTDEEIDLGDAVQEACERSASEPWGNRLRLIAELPELTPVSTDRPALLALIRVLLADRVLAGSPTVTLRLCELADGGVALELTGNPAPGLGAIAAAVPSVASALGAESNTVTDAAGALSGWRLTWR